MGLMIIYDFSSIQIFNQSLDLTKITDILWSAHVVIKRLRGFDIEMKGPILMVDPTANWWYRDYYVSFIESRLDFYHRGSLIGVDLCVETLFRGLNVSLLSGMSNVILHLEENAQYDHTICPFVFDKADVYGFVFSSIQNHLLVHHLLSFFSTNATTSSVLISDVTFSDLYNVEINETIMNRYVFNSIRRLAFFGKFIISQSDLFKSFRLLNELGLAMDQAYDFFHMSTTEWMSSLFQHGQEFKSARDKIDFLNNQNASLIFRLTLDDFSREYTYPNEDFCLFRYLSLNKLMTVQMGLLAANVKSCTFLFLTQNSFIDSYPINFTKLNLEQAELSSCNISHYSLLCSNISVTNQVHKWPLHSNRQDMIFILTWAELIGPIISFPIVSALGFVLNFISILVIKSPKNKKEKLFEEKMFRFILMNSTFNCIECLIYQFKLMSMCLGSGSIFCSKVRTSIFVQNFAIYVTGFLSETMKTCSIMTSVLFSLQRYIDTSKKEHRFMKLLTGAKIAKIAFIVIDISCLFSIVKIYTYSSDDVGFTSFDSPREFELNAYTFEKVWHLRILYFFHYVFNDFFLLIVNLVIDIKLVFVIRNDLTEKLNFKINSCQNQEISVSEKFKNDFKHKQKVENKSNAMIFSTLVMYIFCRIPELLGSVYFYNNNITEILILCKDNILCYLLDNVIEYMYMLSYCLNVIFYYKFNSSFKKGFRNFFSGGSHK